MINLKRTSSNNIDFQNLIMELDNDLRARYNNFQYRYDLDINLENVETVIIAKISTAMIGCGCFKEINNNTVEIKRMFVNPYFRGFGVASEIIDELLKWAKELKYTNAVLETGREQPESIKLYTKHGFTTVSNFGPYIDNEESICMGRAI